MFVDLTVRICQELGGTRNLMTSSLVNILLQWTMPRMNKRLVLQHKNDAKSSLVVYTTKFKIPSGGVM